jgi:hypothetical protein
MPSTATDRLNGLSTSVAVKAPCVAVATSNITLAGLQTVGVVSVVENDRVLATAQTNAEDNGIYDVSSGNWTRSKDFDGNRDAVRGTRVLVRNTGIDGVEYELTTANPIVIGTTELTFVLRYGANTTIDQTAAEFAVPVTPSFTSYQALTPQRYGGIGDGSHPTEDAAAWTKWRQVANASLTDGSWWGPWSRTDPKSFALGYKALKLENTGTENTAIGYNVLPIASAAIRNTAIGANSMPVATAAYQNTAVGVETLFSLSVGTRNCAFGTHALYSTTNENESTAYGASALYSANAAKNTAVGREAGYYITTGEGNVAIGYDALFGDAITKATGFYNVAVGYQSLLSATTAARNVAIGFQSLGIATTAYTCIAIGYGAGLALTTEQYNVILGGSSGAAAVGKDNYVIISDGAGTDRIVIDEDGNMECLRATVIGATGYFIGNATNGYRWNNEADSTTLMTLSNTGILMLKDGITAPAGNVSGMAQLFIDTADGDFKIRYADGTVKTIVVDT